MFERLKHSLKIGAIQRKQRRAAVKFENTRKLAEKDGTSSDAIDQFGLEFFEEDQAYEDEIASEQSQFLRQQAQTYLVPSPEFSATGSQWEESRYTGRWRLVPTEQAKLRSALRQERRERWEEWTRWMPLISSLTGLLGVVVAILALFHKW